MKPWSVDVPQLLTAALPRVGPTHGGPDPTHGRPTYVNAYVNAYINAYTNTSRNTYANSGSLRGFITPSTWHSP
jgi:hypothetical protein